MKHLLKERKGADILTKCLAKSYPDQITVWWREVTCPDCLALMAKP